MDSPTENTPRPPEQTSQSWGAVIGIVIIVVLLIAGGLYFFMSEQAQQGTQAPAVGAAQV